jgi:hypothetical protein
VRVIVLVPVVMMFVIGDVEIDEVLVLADLQDGNARGTATRATRHIKAIAIRISQRGPL